MPSVWPALWPPWKRTTTSARSLSQSTILPLPSSPHWAPITATLAICEFLRERFPEHANASAAGPGGVSLHSMRALGGEGEKAAGTCARHATLGTHVYPSLPDCRHLHGPGGLQLRVASRTGSAARTGFGERPGIAASGCPGASYTPDGEPAGALTARAATAASPSWRHPGF